MPGTLFGFPFDAELFDSQYRQEPNPVTTAILESGAVEVNADIAAQIAGGSDLYTVPFYKKIGITEYNYDGSTDLVPKSTEGGSQSGIVYGRMAAWTAKDFVKDFTDADPIDNIAMQVSTSLAEARQARILGILKAVFGVKSSATNTDQFYTDWEKHTTDISSSTTTVAASNKLGETTIANAITKACGDKAAGAFKLAFMHSDVANNLSGINLLEYAKYTDPSGIERPINIAYINGMTVVVSDLCPFTNGKYTTYVLGNGAIQYAEAPVDNPVEAARDAFKAGGTESLIVRWRETLLPNGFSYGKQTTDGASPTDTMLFSADRYTPIFDPKCIAMAQIISNG